MVSYLAIPWQGARPPRNIIEVFHKIEFLFGPIQCATKLLKLLKANSVFVYLLFCCSSCHSWEVLGTKTYKQKGTDHINYNK